MCFLFAFLFVWFFHVSSCFFYDLIPCSEWQCLAVFWSMIRSKPCGAPQKPQFQPLAEEPDPKEGQNVDPDGFPFTDIHRIPQVEDLWKAARKQVCPTSVACILSACLMLFFWPLLKYIPHRAVLLLLSTLQVVSQTPRRGQAKTADIQQAGLETYLWVFDMFQITMCWTTWQGVAPKDSQAQAF